MSIIYFDVLRVLLSRVGNMLGLTYFQFFLSGTPFSWSYEILQQCVEG